MTCPTWHIPLAQRLGVADELVTEDAGTGDPVEHEGADASMLRAALRGAHPPDVIVALRVPELEVAEALSERGARVLIAYRHPEVDATARFPEFSYSDHILVRWERLLGASGVRTRRADLHLDVDPHQPDRAHTLIHVGAGSIARQWPPANWSQVARSLEAQGHRVVLTGSSNEAALVAHVTRGAGLAAGRDLSGDTDVLALAELVAGARLVLSCDTGVAHLAIGLRRRSVILFGAVSPAWWGPPPGCLLHRCIWKGRLGEPYAPHCDPGLLEISVQEVLDAAVGTDWPDSGTYSCPFLSCY
jgi:hypothetical protein